MVDLDGLARPWVSRSRSRALARRSHSRRAGRDCYHCRRLDGVDPDRLLVITTRADAMTVAAGDASRSAQTTGGRTHRVSRLVDLRSRAR
jgi:hypothetical protein